MEPKPIVLPNGQVLPLPGDGNIISKRRGYNEKFVKPPDPEPALAAPAQPKLPFNFHGPGLAKSRFALMKECEAAAQQVQADGEKRA